MRLTTEKLKQMIKEEMGNLEEYSGPQDRDDAMVKRLSKAIKDGKSDEEIDRLLSQVPSQRKREALLQKARQQSKGFLSRVFGFEE